MIMYESKERKNGIIKDTKAKLNYGSVKYVILKNAVTLVFSSKYQMCWDILDSII